MLSTRAQIQRSNVTEMPFVEESSAVLQISAVTKWYLMLKRLMHGIVVMNAIY